MPTHTMYTYERMHTLSHVHTYQRTYTHITLHTQTFRARARSHPHMYIYTYPHIHTVCCISRAFSHVSPCGRCPGRVFARGSASAMGQIAAAAASLRRKQPRTLSTLTTQLNQPGKNSASSIKFSRQTWQIFPRTASGDFRAHRNRSKHSASLFLPSPRIQCVCVHARARVCVCASDDSPRIDSCLPTTPPSTSPSPVAFLHLRLLAVRRTGTVDRPPGVQGSEL